MIVLVVVVRKDFFDAAFLIVAEWEF